MDNAFKSIDELITEAKQQDYRQVAILNWIACMRPMRLSFLLPDNPETELKKIHIAIEKRHADIGTLLHLFSENYPRHDFLFQDNKTILPASLAVTDFSSYDNHPVLDAEFHQQGQMLVKARLSPEKRLIQHILLKDKYGEKEHRILLQLSSASISQLTVDTPQGYPDNKFQISFAKAAHMPCVV